MAVGCAQVVSNALTRNRTGTNDLFLISSLHFLRLLAVCRIPLNVRRFQASSSGEIQVRQTLQGTPVSPLFTRCYFSRFCYACKSAYDARVQFDATLAVPWNALARRKPGIGSSLRLHGPRDLASHIYGGALLQARSPTHSSLANRCPYR